MNYNEDRELIDLILQIPEETQTIEFKRMQGSRTPGKIVETIVAMANTEGGRIILGIDDPEKTTKKGLERIYGIEENLELYDEIGRTIQNIIPPLTGIWEPNIIKVDSIDKSIAIIKIPKATQGFCSINKEVYQRGHKGNTKLTPHEVITLSYAKGFVKADKELVDVDFELLNTSLYNSWKTNRDITGGSIEEVLFKTGLARKNDDGKLEPTRAAALLFSEYPTNILDTKCTIRVYKYTGTLQSFKATPNLIGKPKTIEGPIIELIKKAHEYILSTLESGIEIHSGFTTKYKIPERPIKEAITNAVIHRDYHIKRDIEVKIFEDRVEVLSPGLLIGNITTKNIGKVRSDSYRNDLLVKHLREFPNPPNLDRNEGVEAMINDMEENNLFPPLFLTYPIHKDSVEVVLINRNKQSEWEKIQSYLDKHTYINNKTAREITGIEQVYQMSKLLSEWESNGLLLKIGKNKGTRYKLSNSDDL